MIRSSKQLYQFYKAYLAWSEATEMTEEFSPRMGLCNNLYDWCMVQKDISFMPGKLSEELHEQFEAAGLDSLLPFNQVANDAIESLNKYLSEAAQEKAHTNTARIQWVRDRIKDSAGLHDPNGIPQSKTV